MLQKCVQYTGAYFKITLFGSIWALKVCNNCITTQFTSRDTVTSSSSSRDSYYVEEFALQLSCIQDTRI